MSRQLALPVGLRDGNRLDNFLASANPAALAAVRSLVVGREPFVYLWGPPGTGRTHLLEAAIEALARDAVPVAYLPLRALGQAGPAPLEGLAEAGGLVCLDDVDAIAGDRAWEEGLFHLYNGLRDRGGRWLVAAGAPPAAAGFVLPDLVSRLNACLVAALQPLDDDARLAVLVSRAAGRGLELPPETGRWLLARTSRRLEDLIAALEVLDRAALAHKRRLTVPFVRLVLGG